MPRSEISQMKKNEFRLVFLNFYPNENWEDKFEKTFRNLQFQKRQAVFKDIKDTHGYGITDTDIDFFYKLPASPQMECFNQVSCSFGSRLSTKLIGDLRVPQRCGDFRFIIIIEKTKSRANIRKIFFDGNRQNLQWASKNEFRCSL